jgi:succinate dehydrogenase/fumarate reductase flavoprotein subunit
MNEISTDVLVVGGGGAGLAAAIEAARFGASVVLLEKNPSLGGSTAWSVGSISVSNSPHQQRLGIKDSPQEHFEDLELLAGANAGRDNHRLRRILVDHTTDMFEWLEGLGLVFIGPHPEPPHRYPRMHNVLPNSTAFPRHLGRKARSLGVIIHTGVNARSFTEAGDRITGVLATDAKGQEVRYVARSGVVLASGDYSANSDLKRKLASEEVAALSAVNDTATGEGHIMAQAIGAEIVNGDIVRGPIMRFVPPKTTRLLHRIPPTKLVASIMRWGYETMPSSLLRGMMMRFLTTALGPSTDLFRSGVVMLNRQGNRFVDELKKPAAAVAREDGNLAYLLMDAAIERKFSAWPYFVSTAPGIAYAYVADYRRTRSDIVFEAPTLEKLAAKVGMPLQSLTKSVAAYNASAERGDRPVIAEPPFLMLGPVRSYVVFTDGGLRVTENLEVQRTDGSIIPGLYAAGSAGQGGLLLEGHGHHLGWAFISGRIAGRNAALRGRGADTVGRSPA